HRQGLATEALLVLIAHLFDDRGHHRLTIDPAADNTAAIACYAGVGFTEVGIMRSFERQDDGTWADGILMELLASDPRPAG
ncbi:MAG: GNAT family protein, partial [Actinomycetota bacterium]